MEKSLVNTIYIMSKGRPECVTAQMLSRIHYPGSWFIVCGDNTRQSRNTRKSGEHTR